jgi:uncharacterized protein YbjT (DUF2867 family)
MSRLLILGATGNIGGQVARQLLDAGATVRVAVRSPDKAAALADGGAEVVRFDYDAPDTWAAALDGVDGVFVVAPFVPDFARPVRAFLQAAVDAGVSHVVKLSASGVSDDAPFALGRQHAAADAAVAASGLRHTILRPTFFMDNTLNFHGHTIRADGAFYGASAGGSVAYVSSADIAAVAAAALTNPSAHDGQTYEITGAEALTDAAVATLVGEQLGKPVSYVDLPPEQLAAGMTSAGSPEWMVEALVALEGVKAQGWAQAVSPVIPDVLGRPPETFAAFLARTTA